MVNTVPVLAFSFSIFLFFTVSAFFSVGTPVCPYPEKLLFCEHMSCPIYWVQASLLSLNTKVLSSKSETPLYISTHGRQDVFVTNVFLGCLAVPSQGSLHHVRGKHTSNCYSILCFVLVNDKNPFIACLVGTLRTYTPGVIL